MAGLADDQAGRTITAAPPSLKPRRAAGHHQAAPQGEAEGKSRLKPRGVRACRRLPAQWYQGWLTVS